ncbi:uncharacterized protein LOC111050556 isoform X2 [Nilaparvata lugens]|uniref:uncharacterized protein LOC111050556 isoform X2 n=1 Tax=Nilaparvata lugens TaxID=108931 RepID=UPI00193E92F1|nr:uncharacterized protein LOC111050556 isoform X2 [Nilaparvata lugens]
MSGRVYFHKAIVVILLPLVKVSNSLMDVVCILPDDPVRIQVLSLMMMVTGISTLAFNIFQKRLPVLFSPSVRYYKNVSSSLSLHNACPGSGDLFAMGFTKRSHEWKSRINTVQSGLIFTNVLTALAGLTGLCRAIDGVISNNLVLVPAGVAIGISQFEDLLKLETNTVNGSSENLDSEVIVTMTIISLVIAALKFGEVKFRVPYYSLKEGFGARECKLFQLFSIFISTFCVIFAYPGLQALIYGSKAYKQASGHAFPEQDDSHRFILHRPFIYGWPKLDYEMMINLLPDVVINIATSVVIFRATRFACGENKTLTRTVSNGVLGESLMNFILAGFGLNANVSAYNIGLGKLTGIMHTRIVKLCGLSLVLIAIHPPTLLAFSRISMYHLQAIHFLISMLVSVIGFSMIKAIRNTSSRDFAVIGSSVFTSFILPNIVLTSGCGGSSPALLKLLSSNILIAIITAVTADKLLEGGKPVVEENNEHHNQNNHLSFSEELFSLCI